MSFSPLGLRRKAGDVRAFARIPDGYGWRGTGRGWCDSAIPASPSWPNNSGCR